MRIVYLLIVCSFLLITSCEQNSSEPVTPIIVSGQVYDFDTEYVIRNANIKLDPTIGIAISDNYGKFNFYDLPPGQYKIIVNKSGYEEYTTNIVLIEKSISIYLPLKKQKEVIEE